jgi:hypothetical protein
MLAHSPPLPLDIDYYDISHRPTAEGEEGAILALKQPDRIRRIRLMMPVRNLQRLVAAIDGEYPILEYLVIIPPIKPPIGNNNTILIFPETLQAPRLRHLTLFGFTLPIDSRLLTTAVGLVTLGLFMDHPSTYFHPNTLLQWLSFMPQLETLSISFISPIPNRDVERQLTHTPITTPVTLPNLRCFRFRGVSTYLEALVRRTITPRPEKLQISFFNQLTFTVPRLLQFMNTVDNLRFDTADFLFSREQVCVAVYHHGAAVAYASFITVSCWHLDWQVSSVAQISNSLGQMFSAVEHLSFKREGQSRSSEEHDEANRRIEWRKLLRLFGNVKTLRIDNGLVEELSRCLRLKDGELPFELLPELQELTYTGSGDTDGDAFTSFIDARQNAARSVTAVTLK